MRRKREVSIPSCEIKYFINQTKTQLKRPSATQPTAGFWLHLPCWLTVHKSLIKHGHESFWGDFVFPSSTSTKSTKSNKTRFGAFSGTSIEQIAISYVKEQDTRATLVPCFQRKPLCLAFLLRRTGEYLLLINLYLQRAAAPSLWMKGQTMGSIVKYSFVPEREKSSQPAERGRKSLQRKPRELPAKHWNILFIWIYDFIPNWAGCCSCNRWCRMGNIHFPGFFWLKKQLQTNSLVHAP